jgi:hypothetical protein
MYLQKALYKASPVLSVASIGISGFVLLNGSESRNCTNAPPINITPITVMMEENKNPTNAGHFPKI